MNSTTLNGAINSTDTTIVVADGSQLETTNGTVVIDTEHIAYITRSGNTLSSCVRGIDGTVPASHSNGATVYEGFPAIAINKIWKPIYEWTSDLSSTNATNYSTEIAAGTQYFQRTFLLWVNKDNQLNWIPADDTVDRDIVVGSDDIYQLKLDRTVFDSVNFVIYNTGEDMYGRGVTWYYYNPNTNLTDFKMRYQPMTDISFTLLKQDRAINSTRNSTPVDDPYKQFPTPGSYPLTNWAFKSDSNKWRALQSQAARTTIASDTEYNDSLREACKWLGRQKSVSITNKLFGLRYKGKVSVKGTNYNPGDLVRVTSPNLGITSQLLRVIGVNWSMTNNQYSCTLDVEEDEKTIPGILIV